MSFTIAIVGAGPWGLAVLDRLVMTALQRPAQRFEVHVIDPCEPGGVHAHERSPHLWLNTVSGQIDSFSAAHFGEPPLRGAMSFLQWLQAGTQQPVDPHGFRPRAAFAAYQRHVAAVLHDNAPQNLQLHWVRATVRELSLAAQDRVRLLLDTGPALLADQVFVCSGHGLPAAAAVDATADHTAPLPTPPYPVQAWDARIQPGEVVAVSGLGLVAVDVVALLTEGRGGRFEREADGSLRYEPSGQEPVVVAYSRSGTPFACRPAVSLDLSTVYEPLYCTERWLAARRLARRGAGLDLDEDLLLPLAAEMRAAYVLRTLLRDEGAAAAAAGRAALQALPPQAVARHVLQRWPDTRSFVPEAWLMPPARRYAGPADFAQAFEARLAFDVAQARKGEAASPFKFALELLRVLRPFIRSAVEHDSLAPPSRRRFFERVAPRLSQLVVGPPLQRGEQWLALLRAGVLRVDLGPSPTVQHDTARGLWRLQSTALDQPQALCTPHLLRGQAAEPALRPEGASLLSSLYRSGLCAAVARHDAQGEIEALLPRLDRGGRPLDATGLPVANVAVLGLPSEGVTYFNHYLPSPKSRSAAFDRIQAVIDRLLPRLQAGAGAGVASAGRTSSGAPAATSPASRTAAPPGPAPARRPAPGPSR